MHSVLHRLMSTLIEGTQKVQTLKHPCCVSEEPLTFRCYEVVIPTPTKRMFCPPCTAATLGTWYWSCFQAFYLPVPHAAHALFTVCLPSSALHAELLIFLMGFFHGSNQSFLVLYKY